MYSTGFLQTVLDSWQWHFAPRPGTCFSFHLLLISPEHVQALQFAALLAVPEQCIALVLTADG